MIKNLKIKFPNKIKEQLNEQGYSASTPAVKNWEHQAKSINALRVVRLLTETEANAAMNRLLTQIKNNVFIKT